MRYQARLAVPLVLALMLGGNAIARGGAANRQQQVPEEMVLALVKTMYQELGMPEPDVLSGAMPDDLRQRTYLPPGARIHGSIVYPDDRATVVVAVDSTIDETKAILRREMPTLGWTASEAFENIGPQTQGAVLIPVAFCNEAGDSVFAWVDARDADGAGSLLRFDYAGDREGSICRPRPQRRPEPPRRDLPRGPERLTVRERASLSDMRPPPPSPMASGACLPGGGGASSMTQTSTELSGREIVQHYADQLEAGGWTRNEPSGPPASFTAAWRRVIDGETSELLLHVIRHPGREHCFSIDLSTDRGAARQ